MELLYKLKERIHIPKDSTNTVWLVLVLLYAIFPLWGNINIFMISGTMAVVLTWLNRKNLLHIRKPKQLLEWGVFGIGAASLMSVFLFCIGIDIGYEEGYETEMWLLIFSLSYLYFICKREIKAVYFKIILHTFSIMTFLCAVRFLVFENVVRNLSSLQIAQIALTSAVLAVVYYSYSRDKGHSLIYLAEASMAFMVLAVNHNIMSLYMMFFLLFLILTYTLPRIEPVKRSLQMFFGFVFLLGSMPLITNYTDLFLTECEGYRLETGVLLDLFLCILGSYVLQIWDRVSVQKEWESIALIRDMQKNLRKVIGGIVFLLLGFCLCSRELEGIPDGMIMDTMKTEAMILGRECLDGTAEGIFYQSIVKYGVLGAVCCSCLAVLMAKRIMDNCRFLHHENFLLTMCAILVGIWVMLNGGSGAIFPIWELLLIFALVPDMHYLRM